MNKAEEKLIRDEAERIKKKMIGGRIYGIEINENTLKDVDILVVGAYYLGSVDNTLMWNKYVEDKLGII